MQRRARSVGSVAVRSVRRLRRAKTSMRPVHAAPVAQGAAGMQAAELLCDMT